MAKIKPKPWKSWKFSQDAFKEALGIPKKATNIIVLVYPNRIEVTAEYKD